MCDPPRANSLWGWSEIDSFDNHLFWLPIGRGITIYKPSFLTTKIINPPLIATSLVTHCPIPS
jgi:hypothetical protein